MNVSQAVSFNCPLCYPRSVLFLLTTLSSICKSNLKALYNTLRATPISAKNFSTTSMTLHISMHCPFCMLYGVIEWVLTLASPNTVEQKLSHIMCNLCWWHRLPSLLSFYTDLVELLRLHYSLLSRGYIGCPVLWHSCILQDQMNGWCLKLFFTPVYLFFSEAQNKFQ